jgi:hypothetical protein
MTPPAVVGTEFQDIVAYLGGSTVTVTGAPNAIVLEQVCDTNKLWKIEATYDGTTWFELATTSTNFGASGQSIVIHHPPPTMLFREKEL